MMYHIDWSLSKAHNTKEKNIEVAGGKLQVETPLAHAAVVKNSRNAVRTDVEISMMLGANMLIKAAFLIFLP